MSVREVSERIEKNRKAIAVKYGSLKDHIKEVQGMHQQLGSFLDGMAEVGKAIPEIDKHNDPLEIKAEDFLRGIENVRASIRQKRDQNAVTGKSTEVKSSQPIQVLTLESFGKSGQSLSFKERAVWQTYELLSKKCNPEEIGQLNAAVTSAFNGDAGVDNFYKRINPLRERYIPGFFNNQRHSTKHFKS
jgi:septal ring factor EnvC (AmiA/AmiB activator)